jgi:DNA topoisomerase-1
MLKLTSGANGKYTADQLTTIELDEVKKMILLQEPKAFDKKGAVKKKVAVKKKTATKKG